MSTIFPVALAVMVTDSDDAITDVLGTDDIAEDTTPEYMEDDVENETVRETEVLSTKNLSPDMITDTPLYVTPNKVSEPLYDTMTAQNMSLHEIVVELFPTWNDIDCVVPANEISRV